jgi:hypothetical protein
MATRVKLNHGGVGELLKSAGVRDDLTSRMEGVLSAAKANAPVVTGNYRDGLEIRQDTTDRVAVRVVGTAPHSHLVEADTGNLARALDAAK